MLKRYRSLFTSHDKIVLSQQQANDLSIQHSCMKHKYYDLLRCQLHFLVPLVVTLLSFVPNDVVCSYFQLTCAHLIEYHIKHRVKRLPMSDLNLFHANDFSISPETFDFLMFTTKKQRQWYEPSTNFQYKHVFPL